MVSRRTLDLRERIEISGVRELVHVRDAIVRVAYEGAYER
jgi:hypothetical protein